MTVSHLSSSFNNVLERADRLTRSDSLRGEWPWCTLFGPGEPVICNLFFLKTFKFNRHLFIWNWAIIKKYIYIEMHILNSFENVSNVIGSYRGVFCWRGRVLSDRRGAVIYTPKVREDNSTQRRKTKKVTDLFRTFTLLNTGKLFFYVGIHCLISLTWERLLVSFP